jgi:hypothetical protein
MVAYRHRGIMESRRDDVKRVDAMTVKVTRVSGYVLVVHDTDVTTAEASVDLTFPVVFTEKPVFTFGAELADNHRPLAGSYPTMSAVVSLWETVGEVTGATEGRYVGATVVTVSTGQAAQNIWLHYSFEGKAIRNPLNDVGSIDDVI